MARGASGGGAPGDYVAMVLSPLLVMALVGSLVYFLLEVVYAGEHLGRMKWILFFFVFAAVLVARIALMPTIAGRAHVYGLIVAGLVWAAMIQFIEYPEHLAESGVFISLAVVLLVWWCAYQLTRDCTHLDESVGASGEGVLQAAGLERVDPSPSNSIERYQHKQKAEAGPQRTPGVWVVYFSLAALPVFGLGQSLIPAEEVGRRNYTFWLMVVYVGSGLGLLLTTTYLGLRLYLQRRRLRMPLKMTAAWLTLGVILVVSLLTVGALLPRPNAEVALFDLGTTSSKEREASRRSVKKDSAGKDRGDRTGDPRKDEKGPKDDPEKDRGRQSPDRQTDSGQSRKDSQKDSPAEKPVKDQQPGKDQKDRTEQRAGDQPPPEPQETSESWLKKLLPVLKWIVFAVLALIVLFVILRALLQFAAGFSSWARNLLESLRRFWEALLGWFQKKEPPEGAEESEEQRMARLPFAMFSNPFADGRAGRMSVAELTRYTFAALEAWSREREMGRGKGETALEFAERVGDELPALEREVRRLGQLYSLVVYGRGGVPGNAREVLERFWETLIRATAKPLSA